MKRYIGIWQLLIVFVVFWTLLGLAFAFISYSVIPVENRVEAFNVFVLNLVKFYLWLFFAPIIALLVKRFNFELRETYLINFSIHVSFCIVFAGLHAALFIPLAWLVAPQTQQINPSAANLFESLIFFGNFYLNFLLYTLIVIVVQAYLLFNKYQSEETRNSRLTAELASAQLQALKMQLQPHFLFNALHSISSLNLADPHRANAMIARLGEFLRTTLDHSGGQMVTLKEEIEFLRCYLEIEQIRFQDRLTVRFDVSPKTLSAEIPHLILQPVVENAVKHGVAPFAKHGEIVITTEKEADRLRVTVADNGTGNGHSNKISSNGTGLQNVRSRLDHLYEEDFLFELKNAAGGGCTVVLEIPYKPANFE